MNRSSDMDEPAYVVATPGRSVCDNNARALARHGLLRFQALGTRKGAKGVPPELTRLNPAIGLSAYAFARAFSSAKAESLRFRLHPWFDHWVRKQLLPGNHIISSYGYANASFRWVRDHGGKTFLDGGNSHPENFWTILTEEHQRWNCRHLAVARHHYERALAMMPDVDFVLSPSTFVSRSFLDRGFKPEQILRNQYPVDISCFTPRIGQRPANQPLTIISTGGLSLRKGCPYMLESFRLVMKRHPSVRFRLIQNIHESARPIVARHGDLPIDWSPSLAHAQLAEWLRTSDIFVLPSLEEGLVRTALEALACGLPAILTPNTGTADYIRPGVNGEIVPIRDPAAIAEAVLKWADRILSPGGKSEISFDANQLSFEKFETEFLSQIKDLGLA